MFNELQETIRLSDNIARAFGIYCPLKALYIDSSFVNANKLKSALYVIPKASYVIDTAANVPAAVALCVECNYDCVLVREGINVEEQLNAEQMIIVPHNYFNFSKWKLGYTLNDLILETLNQPSSRVLSVDHQAVA